MWPSTNLAQWERRHWALVILALLAVTLTPLGWIQWRQVRLLDNVASNQVDSIMWQAYQLERELSRLDDAVHSAEVEPEAADADNLAERYEIFLSRIDLLTKIPRHDLIEGTSTYADARQRLTDFTTMVEPLFADPHALLKDPEALARVDNAIDSLLPVLAELTRDANRAVARFVDERNAQLQQQSYLLIGLATVQALGLLAFVALLVRHIRKQQRQYARLKKLSRELTEARDQAEAANRGKSVFLANMSHEIRTPFQGLLGMLNLLGDAQLTSQQRDYLQTARDSAEHLLGVLNDILDVSTMESGTLKLSAAPVHLPTVVQEVNDLMQVAARDKGLDLNAHCAPDLPAWVQADATRLRQILFNLIGNAIKFTPQGHIMVEVARAPRLPDGVAITVRDTGMGMDRETLERLFTRFYQADNSLRRRIGGTGLGLEISRNLARMMGGDIQVSSQQGMGSVFTVTLSLPLAEAPPESATAPIDPSHSRRLRLLVAEDHPINLKYMSILLEKMGHEATFCENGQEALQLLARETFDAVLLDYHMPVLDGMATTEAIRQMDGPASQIKVILVTADVVNDTRKRALEVGVNEFTSKPLQAQDLEAALARCGLLDPPEQSVPGLVVQRVSGHSPLSSYELPMRLPDPASSLIGTVLDTESYTEVLSMMPDDSLHEMLDTLFAPPEGTVHKLLQALADKDREVAGHEAHQLKGTSLLLGFKALATIAARIELLAKGSDPLTADLPEQVLRDMDRTQQALQQFESQGTAARPSTA
ncbi:ATP-binding protein [Hydrogenophaga sp. NFH-34]|uniref:ATP-binding protein n=1 Tax=Hydrogenophaga sp. NFH-34 TaxID=2744446 RepID=UPI001F417209|nr:ATP-binding protein [Hydrogenophaga sp. NFH-34]